MTIWFSQTVRHALESYGQKFYPLEVGGVLLGWRDGDDRIVTGLIGPGPKSLHGRYAFVPDHGWQISQIRNAFEKTNGDLDYLGDWHTHPDGIAEMSAVDKDTLIRISRKVPGPLMAITAGDPKCWIFGSWSTSHRGMFRRNIICNQHVQYFDACSEWPKYFA